ncbi:MAG: DUF481 domain-containing protein [Myxococcota bacterium]|nr:DUF481 domain-containing protein [Myxococcota bacterium]
MAAGATRLSGNVDHFAVNASLDVMLRIHKRHELFVEGDAVYSAFGGAPVLDKQAGSLLWAWAIHEHLNVFLYSTHGRNRFLTLRYRMTNSLGLCVHSLAPEAMPTSLISFGVTPEHEWWEYGGRETQIRGTLRLTLTAPFTPFMMVGIDVSYAPVFVDMGDFRLYGEAFAELKITREVLALRITVADEFDSRPREGVKGNDLSVVPSLVVHLGR